MTDRPSPDRFKAEMPAIPGVSGAGSRRSPGGAMALRLVAGLVGVLAVLVLGTKLVMRAKRAEPPPTQPTPQIEVPTPAADPKAGIPNATEANPGIATVSEMSKPWSSKEFFFRDRVTGESIPALLIRLPTAAATHSDGYWGLVMTSAYGNCRLEYITDLGKLKTEYGFRNPKHPMVGNPCNRTLFDPTRMVNLPGNVWVRGLIAQGSDLRPPLGIEVKIEGKDVLAVSME
jgi:hypothetical protein